MAARRPDPEGTRKVVGLILYALGMLIGGLLLLVVFVIPAFASPHADVEVNAMLVGAAFALPPLAIYLWMPCVVDRYDPEPWWCLLLALAWGGIAACGFSALINTAVHITGNAVGGRDFGDSKFNRITQAMRQPGSSFKPIVYSAAIQSGVSFDETEPDAPITIPMPFGQPPWGFLLVGFRKRVSIRGLRVLRHHPREACRR